MDFVYSAGVKVWVGKNPKPLTKKEAKRVYQNLLAKAKEGGEITLKELKEAEEVEEGKGKERKALGHLKKLGAISSAVRARLEERRKRKEEAEEEEEEGEAPSRWKRIGEWLGGKERAFGEKVWKAEKAFGMGEIEEEGKRIQKGKLRFALGFVGFVVSIILYLATEAWLLVLPVGITSVYLLITARGSAIDFFEDHPLFIVSLILSTIGFILASWPGLLAGPIFFGLSKAIPKEEIRSAVGKIMLYILLVVAFILFLPKVLEYTHITMSLPLIAIAGVINGIILGYVWTAAETESKEEWEKKLIIEQLKKIKMEEREMKEKSEDRKKREEEEKGEEE